MKIIQIFKGELGDLVLTKNGKIFRIDYYLDIDKNSDVVGYQNKIGLIPVKIEKFYKIKKGQSKK